MQHMKAGEGFRQECQASDRIELFFVLGVWAAFSIAGFLLIARFGTNIPKRDDWGCITRLASSEPSCAVLWRQLTTKYRTVPAAFLPRWGAWHLSPGNLPPAMLAGFSILSMECLGLVFMARWARGRSVYTDAFFPLALLHFGHAVNFLWWEQAWAVAAFGLLALVIALFAQRTWHRNTWAVFCAAVVIVLFSLSSFSPKAASPVLAVALILVAISQFGTKDRGAVTRAVVALLGGAAVLVGFVCTTAGNKSVYPQEQDPISAAVLRAPEFLAISFGPIAKRAWPLSGALAIFLVIATAWFLLRQVRRSREDRLRAALLLLSLGAWCFVGLVVGYVRGRQGGLLDRYALYSAPFLCVPYLAWSIFPAKYLNRMIPFALFAVLLASSSYHFSEGRRRARKEKELENAFCQDVKSGIPMTGIVARHQQNWGISEASFRRGLSALGAAGIVPFAEIAPDPPMKELPLPLGPTASHHMTLKDGVWHGTGRDSQLVFSLSKPTFVYAIRFNYTLHTQRGATKWKVSWVRADTDDPLRMVGTEELLVNFNTARQRREETQTIWVDKPICQIAVSPSAEPCKFRLSGITLLVK